MSNKLLEPTYENLINHYLHDTIGRNEDLFYFVRMLSELDGGSAVALNGAWGSGKTFFVKQAKMLLIILLLRYAKYIMRSLILTQQKYILSMKKLKIGAGMVVIFKKRWHSPSFFN